MLAVPSTRAATALTVTGKAAALKSEGGSVHGLLPLQQKGKLGPASFLPFPRKTLEHPQGA